MTNHVRVLNKVDIYNLYWTKNLSTHKISKIYNVTPQLVRYYAIKYKIPLRPPKSLQKEKYNISEKYLRRMYIQNKLSTTEIAEKLGIKSDSTINLKLRKLGIIPRSMSEAKMKYKK